MIRRFRSGMYVLWMVLDLVGNRRSILLRCGCSLESLVFWFQCGSIGPSNPKAPCAHIVYT